MVDDKNEVLIYDHEYKIWRKTGTVRHDPNFIGRGIIGVHKNGDFIYGGFTINPKRNYWVKTKSGKSVRSLDEINHPDYSLSKNAGIYYYNKDEFYKNEYDNYKVIGSYSVPLEYRCGYRMQEFIQESETKNINKLLPEHDHIIPTLRDSYTIGIEYETAGGFIPEPLCFNAGLIPVKDGSLRRKDYLALEYASIPMYSSEMESYISLQTHYLNKFCIKTEQESLHVHIGRLNRTKENAVAYYKLLYSIQDELYDLFPQAIRKTGSFKKTGMDYCNPLKKFMPTGDVNADYLKIFNIMTSGRPNTNQFEFSKIGEEHPKDPHDNRKWNVEARYKLVNIIPFMFGKTGTVEFRLHTPTFNPDKINLWVNLIIMITSYVERNSNKIARSKKYPKITLADIIDDYVFDDYYYMFNESKIQFIKTAVSEYVKYRKLISHEMNERGDTIGMNEINHDNIDDFIEYLKREVDAKK